MILADLSLRVEDRTHGYLKSLCFLSLKRNLIVTRQGQHLVERRSQILKQATFEALVRNCIGRCRSKDFQ